MLEDTSADNSLSKENIAKVHSFPAGSDPKPESLDYYGFLRVNYCGATLSQWLEFL
jgi:hypothetical protein